MNKSVSVYTSFAAAFISRGSRQKAGKRERKKYLYFPRRRRGKYKESNQFLAAAGKTDYFQVRKLRNEVSSA